MKTTAWSRAALFALMASVVGCSPFDSNKVISQVKNDEDTVTVSKRDSGATSKGSTLVSIRLNSVPDNDTHGLILLGLNGSKTVEIKWIGPHHLALGCSSCEPQDVNFQVVKTGDISITYEDNLREK